MLLMEVDECRRERMMDRHVVTQKNDNLRFACLNQVQNRHLFSMLTHTRNTILVKAPNNVK